MKLSWVVVLLAVFSVCHASAAENKQLKTKKDKMSYAMGINIGNNINKQLVDVDQTLLIQGLEDALSGARPLLTTQEMLEATEALQKERIDRQQEQNRMIAEKNQAEGDAFLAENAKKKNVITLPSGLQYTVITKGEGRKPKNTDMVMVNYRGSLIDGTVFDDTDAHDIHPAVMPVGSDNKMVAGFTEALQLMNEGSKWKIFIPSRLGYKERRLWTVGPDSVLIYDVELISIKQ